MPVPDAIVLNNSDEPSAKRPRFENCIQAQEGIAGTKVQLLFVFELSCIYLLIIIIMYYLLSQVMALPSGPVPCNKPISELISLVKPYIRELVEDSNLVSYDCYLILIRYFSIQL